MLNSKGEVADFLDVNQFIPSRSAYECVAYSAALIKYCGEPGHGPTGTALQASNLAQYYYGLEEGSNLASNTNGMSIPAMENMLQGMGLTYQVEDISHGNDYAIALVKFCISGGKPVLLCGHEDSMYDLELGDKVPYSWTPTGNHAIVVSGVASDGNLLVHDCANIAPTGVRTGPRHYDISKLQIVSATAIKPTWEVQTVIDIHSPGVANYFTEQDANHWTCKQTNKVLQFAMLDSYKHYGNRALCGFTYLGLPNSNEIAIETLDPAYQHLAGQGIVVQFYELGAQIYDPKHLVDNRPGLDSAVYPVRVYDKPGQDPRKEALIKSLQAELAKATQAPQQFAALEQMVEVGASALGKHLV